MERVGWVEAAAETHHEKDMAYSKSKSVCKFIPPDQWRGRRCIDEHTRLPIAPRSSSLSAWKCVLQQIPDNQHSKSSGYN